MTTHTTFKTTRAQGEGLRAASPQPSALLYASALLVASGLALAGCSEVHGEAETHTAPRPVKVSEVRPAETLSGIRYAVSIQPYEQIPLSFKSGGYVDSVMQRRGADGRPRALQAGDAVAAGAIVARVREADYRERINQANASLQELEAAQAKAELDRERARTLFAAQALIKPDLDSAEANYNANVARLASARANIEMAQIAMRDTALVAPRGGIILERKIETGTLVGTGTIGFVLGDVRVVKAIFGVPDSMVHRIALGQRLDITTEAFRGSAFTGQVTAVSPSAEQQSRVFDIEVSIPNADSRLRPGMIGSVEVAADPTAKEAMEATVPAIPLSAIVRSEQRPDQYAVFVVEGRSADESIVHTRAVTLGGVQGNLVAVTTGLAPGERVVVMGATLLKDGEAVRVIP
jgi:RND family efflux transporter MFP subunit